MRKEKEALDNRLDSERKSVCNDEEVARKAFRFNYGEIVKPVSWEQRIGKEKAQRDFAVSMALLNVKLRATKSTTAK